MKVAVLGAGPAASLLAISMKRRNPAHDITVVERNRPDDTFGWGVVLSARPSTISPTTIPREHRVDSRSLRLLGRRRRVPRRTAHRVDRARFCGIGRRRLLLLLQRRANWARHSPGVPRRDRRPRPTWRPVRPRGRRR